MSAPDTTSQRAAKIAALNDRLRHGDFRLGRIVTTRGIHRLDPLDYLAVMQRVSRFDAFTEDNDPHRERDFGSFEHAGNRIFWKIDYYAPDLQHGSEDPTDPEQTVRVLTVMLADEY